MFALPRVDPFARALADRVVALWNELATLRELDNIYRDQKQHTIVEMEAHAWRRERLKQVRHELAEITEPHDPQAKSRQM